MRRAVRSLLCRAIVAASLASLLAPNSRSSLAATGEGASETPRKPAVVAGARLGRELDAWARPLVAAGQLSGNLLIAHRDRIVLERSWGMANYELQVPNTPETRFCVASITKPMTVIVALQLIMERKLGYRDSLARWIPDFPHGDSITIEHLLRHRSGIPHRVTTDEQESQPHTAADMVEFAKRTKLEFVPGERNSYSSGGFAVLARVLELAGGASYPQLLQSRIFGPLGMKHSSHPLSGEIVPMRASNYAPEPGGVSNPPLEDLSFLVGAGSVVMTARDLHLLLWADGSGKLGESFRQSALRGKGIYWNGSTNGFRAFADFDTLSEYSVIWTGNLHTGAVDLLKQAVWALLEGKSPAPATAPITTPVPVAPEALRRHEGLYDVAGNPRLPVRSRPYGLDVNGWALVATSDTTFFSLRDYAAVTAVRAADGVTSRLDWKLGAESFPCPRVADLPRSDAR
ncbi:MAG: beta-lactamase family protein [Candidatus Eisenbacteria bacterium]|uniref:Beta-lactamase family protein n=1 Tax=Eiseniibacteriota bacterium TaxID=2212470 RepID=A0A849SRM1_UNCEI|nr:beta-lactamase family protein [Candidatus Eisenbacteria bacterium]